MQLRGNECIALHVRRRDSGGRNAALILLITWVVNKSKTRDYQGCCDNKLIQEEVLDFFLKLQLLLPFSSSFLFTSIQDKSLLSNLSTSGNFYKNLLRKMQKGRVCSLREESNQKTHDKESAPWEEEGETLQVSRELNQDGVLFLKMIHSYLFSKNAMYL